MQFMSNPHLLLTLLASVSATLSSLAADPTSSATEKCVKDKTLAVSSPFFESKLQENISRHHQRSIVHHHHHHHQNSHVASPLHRQAVNHEGSSKAVPDTKDTSAVHSKPADPPAARVAQAAVPQVTDKPEIPFVPASKAKDVVDEDERLTQGHKGDTTRAFGYASGTTGGGDAPCEAPKDNAELEAWLGDDVPRCILIDKTFDFRGTMGKATGPGCRPASDSCGTLGQVAIVTIDAPDWCASQNFPSVEVTYDKAALANNAMLVKSDKTIKGVGTSGIIMGRGILLWRSKNVIIQNIWFTQLNSEYIFGGDAIALKDTDNVWIDHCRFSMIGRQMIATGYEPFGRLTVSNNEFDGATPNSATCNGLHYWTMLFYGIGEITLHNNHIHSVSGRAPKVAGKDSHGAQVKMHATNNYFSNIQGNGFQIGVGAEVFAENNYFEDVTRPMWMDYLNPGGFAEKGNVLINSGPLFNNFQDFTNHDQVEVVEASATPKDTAGCGKI